MKAKYKLFVMMIMLSPLSLSQALFDWETSYCVENGLEFIYTSGQFDNGGNSYYAGNIDTIVDIDPNGGVTELTPIGSSAGFILKLDTQGNFVSIFEFQSTNSSGSFQISGFDMNANNEMIITGVYMGTVDFDPGPNTYFLSSSGVFGDGFTLKLDTSGNIIWLHESSIGQYIFLEDNGEIYSFQQGSPTTQVDLDPTSNVQMSNYPPGVASRVIVKYNANGGYLWHRSIQSTNGSWIMGLADMASDSLGNSYYVGGMNSPQSFDPSGVNYLFDPLITNPSLNTVGNVIFKLSDQGDLLWEHVFVDSIDVHLSLIEVGPDQNINVAGGIRGTNVDMDFGADTAYFSTRIWTFFGTSPGFDIYLGKYTSDGDFLWGGTIGIDGNDALEGRVAVDSVSNFYLTTRYASNSFGFDVDPGPDTVELIPNIIGRACLVLKLDSAGVFQWAKTTHSDLLNASNTYGSNVFPSNISLFDNSILITGAFDGAVDFDVTPGIIYADSTCALPGNLYADFMWQLEQCDPIEFVDSITSCDNLIWMDGNTYSSDTTNAIYTIETPGQCDTIYRLVFEKLEESIRIDSVTSCGPYTWINGATYSLSTTTPLFVLPQPAVNGCDSVANLHVNITQITNAAVQNGTTIEASLNNAQYQWLDCDNNFTPLIGDTLQSFTASVNGNYAVEVTNGNCVDTSACFSVTTVGMSEMLDEYSVRIYPNPSYDHIDIECSAQVLSITILDSKGREQLTSSNKHIDVSNLANGIYLIHIETGWGRISKRFTKQ